MTAESSPEPAMRRACDAIMAGDFFSAMADLTPEAANQAMELAAGLSTVPMPQSYEIVSYQEREGLHRFRVRFVTAEREFQTWANWRQVDGAWKIVALGVEDL
jgi:hypothetical protein